jgi:hypothetical protein
MSYFKRIINWIAGFLRYNPVGRDAGEIPERKGQETPVVEISRTPGLTCPECGYRIQVSIPSLLSGQPLVCAGCSLVLHVEQEKSAAALGALKQLDVSLNQAQQKQKEAANYGGK